MTVNVTSRLLFFDYRQYFRIIYIRQLRKSDYLNLRLDSFCMIHSTVFVMGKYLGGVVANSVFSSN